MNSKRIQQKVDFRRIVAVQLIESEPLERHTVFLSNWKALEQSDDSMFAFTAFHCIVSILLCETWTMAIMVCKTHF